MSVSAGPAIRCIAMIPLTVEKKATGASFQDQLMLSATAQDASAAKKALAATPISPATMTEVLLSESVTSFSYSVFSPSSTSIKFSRLDMVNFNLDMIRAMKSAPQTANYNKEAYTNGQSLGIFHGGFDAKQ